MSLFKAWGAAKPHEHSFTRSQRGDTYDPCALAVSDGLKARVARDQIEINMKTGAMPQGCGSSMYSRQMKMEFPQAPEPIIGMSDLRAQVRGCFLVTFQRIKLTVVF